MSDVAVTIPVSAPADEVWRRLTDWPAQSEWMVATTVREVGTQRRAPGDRLEAFTGLGPIGFLDTMTVTEWVDGESVTVAHTGRVVRGSGTFTVRATGPGASEVIWHEGLAIPGGTFGRLLWQATRPIGRWAVTHSLRRFARLAESAVPSR